MGGVLTKTEFLHLVQGASLLEDAKADAIEHARLTGKNIALVFEKNSTRTRCALEVAAHDQGAHVTYLGTEGSHLGREALTGPSDVRLQVATIRG